MRNAVSADKDRDVTSTVRDEQLREPREWAVVTGASSGIGAAFAEQLAQRGYDLLLVARRKEQLAAVATRLGERYGVAAEALGADLSTASGLETVEGRVIEAAELGVLVNNAGSSTRAPLMELDANRIEEIVRVKVVALARLTRAALPRMVARGTGAIINVSSLTAFIPRPTNASYGATNAFINSFTEAVAEEIRGTGVQVQSLCPGAVRTEFFEKAGWDVSGFPPSIFLNPDLVALASLEGLRLGEIVCAPSLENLDCLAEFYRSRQLVFDEILRGEAVGARYLTE
jgi:short-subunit dehydrogenase